MREFKFAAVLLVLALQTSVALAADVTMSIIVSNPLDKPKTKMEVRQELPRELKKEDIVDVGGMTLGYDEQKSCFYVETETDLGPKEKKSYQVTVKDVWTFSPTESDFIMKEAQTRLQRLEAKDYYGAAQKHKERIAAMLDDIKKSGESPSSDTDQRIETYRVNMERLKDLRETVTLMENFVRESLRFEDFEKQKKTIKLTIESENASEKSVEGVELVRYLPVGIRPEFLQDQQGFDLRYDVDKELFYLYKKEDFGPKEKKAYDIVISDMWFVSKDRLAGLQTTSENLAKKLVGSSYEKISSYIVEEIKKISEEITASQAVSLTPEEKVAAYAINAKKLQAMLDKVDQLRAMVDEVVKNKPRKINEVFDAVSPDLATTWKLIYGIIGFLAVISIFFFFLWWGQSKVKLGQQTEDIKPGENVKKNK